MNKKRPIPEVETLSEESQFFYAVLNNESDLACVLIASSFLDNALAGLLKRYFIDSSLVNKLLDSPRGALSTFASRADLAYCLGLIPKGLYQNLETIGRIRNTFAHSYVNLTLEDPSVRPLVESLNAPLMDQTIIVGPVIRYGGPSALQLLDIARDRFNTVVVIMLNVLLVTGLSTKHRENKRGNWQ